MPRPADPRVLRLSDRLLGFYAGRVPGHQLSPDPTWVEDGALSLGICSYAIVDGGEALVYDTHVSVEHAAAIRRTVEAMGARRIRVVLSHWHLDHVAGTEAFADCEVIAGRLTGALLAEHRDAIEAGAHAGPPAIRPLVLPTTTLDGPAELRVGRERVELLPFDIHSADATVLRLPDAGLLLVGDTLEDTVTYVAEPEHLATHLTELERLRALGVPRLLPNHGSPDAIAAGGYQPTLIDATEHYVRALQRHARDPRPEDAELAAFFAEPLAAGWAAYFAPYERVHRANLQAVERVAAASGG